MPLLGPMGRRGRRRGLIVGAAVGHHMGKKSAEAQAPQPDQQTSAPTEDPQTAKLEELAKLHNEGVLTDEEFASKKKQILGT